MLEVEDLWTGYGHRTVLRGISLHVDPGEVVAVLGTNGAGKSTLLNCLAGNLSQQRGHVRFKGQDISRVPTYERARRGLVLVPEGQQTFPAMSVAENLWVGARASGDSGRVLDRHIEEVLGRFPRLAERRNQAAGTLSGGERQMLALGRAMLGRPSLLMLDEPSHGLSPVLVEQVAEMVKSISETTSMLIVEQNLMIPTHCAERVLVLEEAEIRHEGEAKELLQSASVISAYLGI
jgi:branched-chain amino acid transport system ATP-binding protein